MQSSAILSFAYVEQFRCLADRCQDNCCHIWRIALEEESIQRYRDHPALLDLIVKDESGYSMRQKNMRCISNERGICAIHRDYGETLLPNTCRDYPRMYRSLNQFFTRAGTLSCPEITRKCLFDDDPFLLVESELPPNHQNGQGFVQGIYNDLTPTLWQQIVSGLIDMIVDENTTIEENIVQLLSLTSAFDDNHVTNWPALVAAQRMLSLQSTSPKTSHDAIEKTEKTEKTKKTKKALSSENTLGDGNIGEPEGEDVQQAERSTLLLMVLLEHLDRPGVPEYLRQGVISAFTIIAYDRQQHPKCQLLPPYKSYYQTYGRNWIQHILKRFAGAEITRVGFPFVSATSAGQDYGKSLAEWSATLCLRLLSLRLLLTISGTHMAKNGEQIPEESMLVEWVFQFTRRMNHQPKGVREVALLHQLMTSEGPTFYDYLEMDHL